jgi:hypothetical protein
MLPVYQLLREIRFELRKLKEECDRFSFDDAHILVRYHHQHSIALFKVVIFYTLHKKYYWQCWYDCCSHCSRVSFRDNTWQIETDVCIRESLLKVTIN